MRISGWSSDVCSSDLLVVRRPAVLHGTAGNADDVGALRHLPGDHRVGADARAAADREGAEDLRAGADDDVVLERRVALHVALAVAVAAGRGAAEGDALVERHIVADLRRLADPIGRASCRERVCQYGEIPGGAAT